jgi:hypothetical protein
LCKLSVRYYKTACYANAIVQHYQAGFQSGKSITDQLFPGRQTLVQHPNSASLYKLHKRSHRECVKAQPQPPERWCVLITLKLSKVNDREICYRRFSSMTYRKPSRKPLQLKKRSELKKAQDPNCEAWQTTL